jgi:hypothetical protein
MRNACRKALVAVVGVGFMFTLTVLLSEAAYRFMLFSHLPFMERYRDPSLYTDYYSDGDWWKLYYLFGKKEHEPTKHPHHLLGWTGDFSGESYRHDEAGRIHGKRPVLLYGDSFARCLTAQSDCFQGILNNDKEFSRQYFMLNYGVAGYGVDQIYLLLKNSIALYEHPYVVVGLYTRDLDRSILPLFVGQKPYFDVVSDDLVLRGTPISDDPTRYLSDNPPKIWSYLYRLWLYQDGRPWRLRLYLRDTDEIHRKKLLVNEKIVVSMIRELQTRKVDHTFVIFADKNSVNEMEWREGFLLELLDRHDTPYLSSRVIIMDDAKREGRTVEDYYIPVDGHPNAYQNSLVAKELKGRILMGDVVARVN